MSIKFTSWNRVDLLIGPQWIINLLTGRIFSPKFKKLLCNFLGVDVNSKNDIIKDTTDCPSVQVRQRLLRHSRTVTLVKNWDSANSQNTALLYGGDDPQLDDEFDSFIN